MKTLATIAGGALFFVSWPAAANGRFPMANQIVFSPTDPRLIVLRASYGIMRSHDNGETWKFLCDEAIGLVPNSFADPTIGLTGNDSLLLGVSLGLSVSHDTGCNWSCKGGPLANQIVADLAVRPDLPSRAVAVTDSYAIDADSGQSLYSSRIFETTDDGVHWAPLGSPIDPLVDVDTIEVAKTDPNRLYVSGMRYGAERNGVLFVSKDKGQTWIEWSFPTAQFDPATEDRIFIGAVDPTNADRVYIRSNSLSSGGQSRLTTVTFAADGTPTFSTAHAFEVAQTTSWPAGVLGFALSSDGKKVYIGSQEDGLWVAQTSDLAFHKNSSIGVQCLATRGDELWACSSAFNGFIVGVSTDDGKTFTAKLPLIGALAGPIECAPNAAGAACGEDANASRCGSSYESFCSMYECGSPDASVRGDASVSGDASQNRIVLPSGTATASFSSCDLAVGGGGAAGFGAALSLVGVALQRRKRRGGHDG